MTASLVDLVASVLQRPSSDYSPVHRQESTSEYIYVCSFMMVEMNFPLS
jgi:hypothetical protein